MKVVYVIIKTSTSGRLCPSLWRLRATNGRMERRGKGVVDREGTGGCSWLRSAMQEVLALARPETALMVHVMVVEMVDIRVMPWGVMLQWRRYFHAHFVARLITDDNAEATDGRGDEPLFLLPARYSRVLDGASDAPDALTRH